MVIFIVLDILLIIVITIIYIQYKNKKNIGQKISFLYNQVYTILIKNYYDDPLFKKNILKDELNDYYNSVVRCSDIVLKYEAGDDIKAFLLQYYSNQKNRLSLLYDMIDTYYNNYYKSVNKSILLLLCTLIILVGLLLFMIFKY